VLWGGLHGLYLAINHGWRAVVGEPRFGVAGRLAAATLTFAAVVVGWVVFRASDLTGARAILCAMAGFGGVGGEPVIDVDAAAMLILPLLGVVWLAPNTQELTGYAPPGAALPATARLQWTLPWATAAACLFALAFLSLSKVSEFLYFQF
jgi:alginate O-acetyltransferase complex protein AlgI